MTKEQDKHTEEQSDGLTKPLLSYGFRASFVYATNGLLRTLCTQRNMKIHWVAGLAVMLVGMALPLELASRATLLFCVFLVIAMEVLNTALEAFVDLHVEEFEKSAMVAKDAAAAAVLIFAAGAVIIFADVLIHRWDMVSENPDAVLRTTLWGVPVLASCLVILFSRRNIVIICGFTMVAIGLLSYLVFHSRDEVFSLGALSFLVVAATAKIRENALLNHE